jgi:hypothetical protein
VVAAHFLPQLSQQEQPLRVNLAPHGPLTALTSVLVLGPVRAASPAASTSSATSARIGVENDSRGSMPKRLARGAGNSVGCLERGGVA